MLIQGDMTQAPDRRTILPANFYEARITGVEDKPPKNPETKGVTISVNLEIVNNPDPDINGRQITGYTFIPADLSRKDALTGIKRIFLSAGIPVQPGGMDTRWLIGRTVRIHVTNGTSKDERTGVMRETANVNEFMIPGEQGPGAPAGVPQPPGGMPPMAATMGAAPQPPSPMPAMAPQPPAQMPAMPAMQPPPVQAPQAPAPGMPQMPQGFVPPQA